MTPALISHCDIISYSFCSNSIRSQKSYCYNDLNTRTRMSCSNRMSSHYSFLPYEQNSIREAPGNYRLAVVFWASLRQWCMETGIRPWEPHRTLTGDNDHRLSVSPSALHGEGRGQGEPGMWNHWENEPGWKGTGGAANLALALPPKIT